MQMINADLFRQMILAGAQNLEINRAAVDALNVFPVPDGDTGTNMNLTLQAVVKATAKVEEAHVGRIAVAAATGSLMGARGNSGVILSQLFRGVGQHLQNKKTLTALDLMEALKVGTDTVYKAVRKPVEGTMLTVMKDASRIGYERTLECNEVLPALQVLVDEAAITLAKTPDMLPVLKRAGVVDAGGQGLLYIFQGWLAAAGGQVTVPIPQAVAPLAQPSLPQGLISPQDIEFGYCTEFLVMSPQRDEGALLEELNRLGDSLMVVGDKDLFKVHVHTNNPGQALEIALSFGELSGIKIENMREQHTALHMVSQPEPQKPLGVVAVAVGDGLAEIFASLGVDLVVAGGQTMNPSTEDLAKAAAAINAERIIILPNNKNIVMAAEQVQEVVDKPIHVVPSRSIPQGLSALMSYQSDAHDIDAMVASMIQNMSQVKSGQVTVAVRDHEGPAGKIQEGDYIGIDEGDIVAYGQDMEAVVLSLTRAMVTEDAGLLSIFYGEDVAAELAEALAEALAKELPDVEIELLPGGQAIYHFIVAVE